jgi:hypothetical protein
LIEKEDAVFFRVKKSTLPRAGAAARATVYKNHGFALRVSRLLIIQFVNAGDF